MKIISFDQLNKASFLDVCVDYLKKGGSIACPTETSYALVVDALNPRAVRKLFQIKGREFTKPVHVLVVSIAQAKRLVVWNAQADALAKSFWPGPLTLVLPLRKEHQCNKSVLLLTAGTGFLGLRMSPHALVRGLIHKLRCPVTATSCNLSGRPDSYSADEVAEQFRHSTLSPDILIYAGKQRRTRPSTVVKILDDEVVILRKGPVSKKAIKNVLDGLK